MLPLVIAVVRSETENECRTIVRGLVVAGLSGIEITMTVPGAVGLLAEFAEAPSVLEAGTLVGAGTVLEARSAASCVAAGARFVVSPVTDVGAARAAQDAGVPYVGGALTPTEISGALALGCDAVKIFPIGTVGGPRYLAAVREPFPTLRAVVSGGVTPADAPAYLAAGAVAISMGGALIDRAAARRGDVDGVATKAAAVLRALASAEGG